MKSKDVFGVAVRIIGLAFLYQAIAAVPAAVTSIWPTFPRLHIYFSNILPSLWMVGWPLLAAYWLISGAPQLMRIAYPEKTGDLENKGAPPLS
jgi:hypothetical protein